MFTKIAKSKPIHQLLSLHSRQFHRTIKTRSNDRVRVYADIIRKDLPKNATLKDILTAVWKNESIKAMFGDLMIRLTTFRGEVSKLVYKDLGGNPDQVNILAVGTTEIPHHLTSYHSFLDNYHKNVLKFYNEYYNERHDYTVGYDLTSNGDPKARELVLRLFNEHYGFTEAQIQKMIQNSAITCGGMRSLKDIADAHILIAKSKGAVHRFISPDNSFGTWWNIIENPDTQDKFRREIYTIATSPENKLHLTANDVKEFYEKHGVSSHESWYITPVGNPSGTKATPEQLVSTCEMIHKYNPQATIILDIVYARTLPKEQAKKLFEGLVNNDKLMNSIIFVESFSKSHGLCRERLGMYFSTNEELYTRIHATNISFSAGNGVVKDFQFKALGSQTESDKQGVADLHEFWKLERRGLYNYLMSKHGDLFDPHQKHITEDDISNSLGLYIFLKTKEGINAQDVFMNTGALGVDTKMASGNYIRFSVGTLLKPTYKDYA